MKTPVTILAITVALCGLAACNQAPTKAGAASQASAVAAASTASEQLAFKAPPIPDPSRTDPEAVAMRKRYVDWKVAQVIAANAVAQKQMEKFYGSGAPKGAYGKMAEGLPPAKAG